MKKILFISNISNKITNFSIPSIIAGQSLGYEFHMTANYSGFKDDASKYNVILHHIDLVRNPLSLHNIKAYRQIITLINKEKFDVIHCNTPIGGILGRICGNKTKVHRIVYTVHGFHFYKGAPFINRTIYKWAEKWLSHYTDAIITINQWDYEAAKKFRLRKNGKVYYVPGVGIDTHIYNLDGIEKNELRKSLGLEEDDIVIIAMGDLIKRKNYLSSIKAIAKANNSKLHFLICGEGPELETLMMLTKKLKLEKQIHFLGFRTDIKELLAISDIFLFTTYQEGLPRSMMEAMAAGLPCVSSRIRGNIDLIDDGKGGCLYKPDDIEGFANAINILAADKRKRDLMRIYNYEKIKQFDVENVKEEMYKIYFEVLGGGYNEKA